MNNLDEVYFLLNKPHRYDNYIAAICPFHDDSRPSFFVYDKAYYCSACNKRGKTADLIKYLTNNQYVVIDTDDTNTKNPWSKWTKYTDLETVCLKAHKFAIEQNRTSYIKERGIDMKTIKALKLGWKDNWVIFPILDQNSHISGGTSRVGKKATNGIKYSIPRGQDANMLYVPSWDRVWEKNVVFLTFGIIDAISIYQLGYASISTTTGKRLNPEALNSIRKKIVIIPDDNEVIDGVKLAYNLGWRGEVMRIDYTADTKDVNDLFLYYSEFLKSLLAEYGEKYERQNWHHVGGS
jgi:hypothetical protein